MGLLDTLPSSHNTLSHMVGAVAFERSFAELYACLQRHDPCSPSEGLEIVSEAILSERTPYIDIVRASVAAVFGGECDTSEMRYALKGYLAEAAERFVTRAAEVESVHVRANLNSLYGSGEDGGWSDAAAAFKR
jgi:hypothetical protein